jgi:hypothetical protein
MKSGFSARGAEIDHLATDGGYCSAIHVHADKRILIDVHGVCTYCLFLAHYF